MAATFLRTLRHRLAVRLTPQPVCHVLQLSTMHLPEHVADEGLDAQSGIVAHNFDTGWLMWIPSTDYPDSPFATSDPSLTAIIAYARRRRCRYVLFDRDAELVPDLPEYDW